MVQINQIKFVLIKFKVNLKVGQRLIEAGVKVEKRSIAKTLALISKHKEEAEKNEVEADRYQRTDASGPVQADSGELIFVIKDSNLCIRKMEDLSGMGLFMSKVSLLKKEGDYNYTLIITFEPQKTYVEPNVGNDAKTMITQFFMSIYKFIYVYANPDQTLTVNVSSRLDMNSGAVDCILPFFTEENGVICVKKY